MLDSLVPKTVDAKVEDGFVTLTGTADWQYQRDEAEFVASNIVGALDVFDEIELEYPTPSAGDVKESIGRRSSGTPPSTPTTCASRPTTAR